MAKRTVYEVTTAYRGGSASTRAFNSEGEARRYYAEQMLKRRRQPVGGRILDVSGPRAKVIGR